MRRAYKRGKNKSRSGSYLSVLGRLNKLTLGQSVLDVHLCDDAVDATLNLDGEHGRSQAGSVREHDQSLALLKNLNKTVSNLSRVKRGKAKKRPNEQKKLISEARFRSWDLWVMGPTRFHCATSLCWLIETRDQIRSSKWAERLRFNQLWIRRSYQCKDNYYGIGWQRYRASNLRERRGTQKRKKVLERVVRGRARTDRQTSKKIKNKKNLDSQGFDPRTSRMLSGRATKCTTNPLVILVEKEHVTTAIKPDPLPPLWLGCLLANNAWSTSG